MQQPEDFSIVATKPLLIVTRLFDFTTKKSRGPAPRKKQDASSRDGEAVETKRGPFAAQRSGGDLGVFAVPNGYLLSR